MDLGIDGKTSLITGATGGLGKATAKLLQGEGVRLILSDLDADALRQVQQDFSPDADAFAADLTTTKGALALRDLVGDVDILVHTAGITGAKGDPLQMSDDDFEACWQTNFMSAMRLARAFAPGMVTRGWGRMIFVVSENAVQPYPEEAVYNASKAALLNFTKSASLAYGPKGILINAVAPAFIQSPMTDQMMQARAEEEGVSFDAAVESFLEEERPHLTLKRRGQPDEVASVIALLASNRATFTNGSAYRVDGGAVAALNL